MSPARHAIDNAAHATSVEYRSTPKKVGYKESIVAEQDGVDTSSES